MAAPDSTVGGSLEKLTYDIRLLKICIILNPARSDLFAKSFFSPYTRELIDYSLLRREVCVSDSLGLPVSFMSMKYVLFDLR